MIKLYLGGIGSGKSISVIKEVLENKSRFYTNFKMYNVKNNIRLKVDNIIKTIKEEKKVKQSINWQFWREQIEKHKNFNIAIDELHNLMHSRRSMSKFNILMSMWIAQIRKICGSSENTHFYSISQELERIDISVRDLANVIIWCRKMTVPKMHLTKVREGGRLIEKMLPEIWILRYYFLGSTCTNNYTRFRDMNLKAYNFRTRFLANDYFQYYDSYELIDFGEGEYL